MADVSLFCLCQKLVVLHLEFVSNDKPLFPVYKEKGDFLVCKIQPFHLYINSSFVLSFIKAVLGFYDKEI